VHEVFGWFQVQYQARSKHVCACSPLKVTGTAMGVSGRLGKRRCCMQELVTHPPRGRRERRLNALQGSPWVKLV
jgi:hypothetical protein